MRQIHITEAKQIAQRVGADTVVVFAFNADQVSGASYAITKAKCDAAGKWLDGICSMLERGLLDAP